MGRLMFRFANIDALTIGASDLKNEDTIAFSENFAFVIDGATGLKKDVIPNEISDAEWLSRETKKELYCRFQKDDATEDCLEKASKQLAGKYPTKPHEGPSASISVTRLIGDKFELFSICDCITFIHLKDGTIIKDFDESIELLDGTALAEMKKHIDDGASATEAREQISDILVRNRDKRNTPDGYWIYDLTGEGISHARQRIYDADEVEEVLMMSDGFYELFKYGISSEEAIFEDYHTYGLNFLLKRLMKEQEKDSEMKRVIRFKFRDDISAIYFAIERTNR